MGVLNHIFVSQAIDIDGFFATAGGEVLGVPKGIVAVSIGLGQEPWQNLRRGGGARLDPAVEHCSPNLNGG